ncbi:MAG: TIGR02710 family CRISPR-associated CARF protein [Candidatus Omnitrophota bacterium]
MSKAMIISVGVGETVSHGICCSIRQQNPDYVIFILTKESKEKTLPLVLNDRVMKDRKYEQVILSDENDVEEVKFGSLKKIEDLMRRFEPKDIAVDYTTGTKAMSAGITLAALEKRIGTLVYVSGKRDKNGRVISGTEKVISIEPNRTYAELLFKEAINSFNNCQFNSCLEFINQAKPLVAEFDFQNKIELLEKLAQAYSLWDKFDLGKAFLIIDEISKNQLLSDWGIRRRIENNKEFLHKEKENLFCSERVVDLFENAKRKGNKEYKFDNAVACLYRCLEYIAQLKIFQKKLYTQNEKMESDVEALDINKLPSDLKDKYLKYKDEKDGKVKLGLYQDYELLFDLKDEAGIIFKNEYENGNLKKLLSLRNKSILAHGFNPISKDTYEAILTVVEKFVKSLFPETENLIEKVKFPEIRI